MVCGNRPYKLRLFAFVIMYAIIHSDLRFNHNEKTGCCFICLFINITASADTKVRETQMINEFNLPIPNEHRNIRLRFVHPAKKSKNLPQLIIIATGLYSQMDKTSQVKLAEDFQRAGFATLQFNFMALGYYQQIGHSQVGWN